MLDTALQMANKSTPLAAPGAEPAASPSGFSSLMQAGQAVPSEAASAGPADTAAKSQGQTAVGDQSSLNALPADEAQLPAADNKQAPADSTVLTQALPAELTDASEQAVAAQPSADTVSLLQQLQQRTPSAQSGDATEAESVNLDASVPLTNLNEESVEGAPQSEASTALPLSTSVETAGDPAASALEADPNPAAAAMIKPTAADSATQEEKQTVAAATAIVKEAAATAPNPANAATTSSAATAVATPASAAALVPGALPVAAAPQLILQAAQQVQLSTEDAADGLKVGGLQATATAALSADMAQPQLLPSSPLKRAAPEGGLLLRADNPVASQNLPDLTQQAVAMIRQHGHDRAEARLSLHPAELGPLDLKIEQNGQRLEVSVTVDNEAARRAVHESMQQLRERLGDAGMQMGSLDINLRDKGQRQNNDAPAMAQQNEPEAAVRKTSQHIVSIQQNALDLYA